MLYTCSYCGLRDATRIHTTTDPDGRLFALCTDCDDDGLADQVTNWLTTATPRPKKPSTMLTKRKPLGRKAYGSIPHLLGSRLGPGDHHVPEGQHLICTRQPRDRHDRIVVTEKLDGANTAVANLCGVAVPLSKAGYHARTSPYPLHHLFADWVAGRRRLFLDLLAPGEVLHGEWMAQAHDLRYDLPHGPFVVFDLTQDGRRLPFDEVMQRAAATGLPTPHVLSDGPALGIEHVQQRLANSHHGLANQLMEGAVWRVERHGTFDFMAKWVRPDKTDGALLPEISGGKAVWNNWRE